MIFFSFDDLSESGHSATTKTFRTSTASRPGAEELMASPDTITWWLLRSIFCSPTDPTDSPGNSNQPPRGSFRL